MELNLINDPVYKFDAQFPVYNFFFPSQINIDKQLDIESILPIVNQGISSRALYFHFPFCETICSFCPFTRGMYKDKDEITRYVDCIIDEIKLKATMLDLHEVPVESIFFGGGTPSLLEYEHIMQIGKAIHDHFDLSKLREFCFEIEVKSINARKVEALKAIGVTHPRFGLQTFDLEWRENFDLTATIEDLENAAKLLNANFEHVSFDVLYGMHGQSVDALKVDLDKAISLGTKNIDIYPIDNVMTQAKLHKKIARKEYPITTAKEKFHMRLEVDKYMRSRGFMPHNGHGYVKAHVTDDTVTDEYSFVYHEHVYGYSDKDILGFGVNAVSSVKEHVFTNCSGREQYIRSIREGKIPCSISRHHKIMDLVKPLLLRLTYHGRVDKQQSNIDRLPIAFIQKFDELIEAGLIAQDDKSYFLTKDGWNWYTNITYYLMPDSEKDYIGQFIYSELDKPGKTLVVDEVMI